MTRGIDHIVHAVHDLDAARDVYDRLGFVVGAENRHPWGTHNRLVQFAESYIELLAVSDPDRLPRVPPGTYSFGNFNREYLESCGEGFSFLVLRSSGAEKDKASFDKAGFGGFAAMDFSRKALRPDGSETEVSFSLAFARDPKSQHAGFFTCRHRTPEEIWFPELQRHENGAVAISAAVLAAENPTDHHIFMEAFSGARDIRATSLGLTLETPNGEILVYDPRAFLDSFGCPAPEDEGMRLSALTIAVSDIEAVRKRLRKNGFTPRELHNRLAVGPAEACGAVIGFETA
jgi:catechol 2,3-dioxygenase-like lactoylglutathione lyase family enzyme